MKLDTLIYDECGHCHCGKGFQSHGVRGQGHGVRGEGQAVKDVESC